MGRSTLASTVIGVVPSEPGDDVRTCNKWINFIVKKYVP